MKNQDTSSYPVLSIGYNAKATPGTEIDISDTWLNPSTIILGDANTIENRWFIPVKRDSSVLGDILFQAALDQDEIERQRILSGSHLSNTDHVLFEHPAPTGSQIVNGAFLVIRTMSDRNQLLLGDWTDQYFVRLSKIPHHFRKDLEKVFDETGLNYLTFAQASHFVTEHFQPEEYDIRPLYIRVQDFFEAKSGKPDFVVIESMYSNVPAGWHYLIWIPTLKKMQFWAKGIAGQESEKFFGWFNGNEFKTVTEEERMYFKYDMLT